MNGKPDALEGACPVWGGEAGRRLDRVLPLTLLALVTKGVYLSLYAVTDLYSRYTVAWMVSLKENSALSVCAGEKPGLFAGKR